MPDALKDREDAADGREPLQRFLAHAYSRSTLAYLAMGALLIVASVLLGREVAHHIDAIEAWIVGLGPWGRFVFLGLFVLATSFLFPESVFAVTAGALFGLATGMAVVMTGNLLAASLQFLLSRHLLRTRIQRELAARPALAMIQRAVNRNAFRLQVLLRLTPLNPATVSYLLGAAGVRFPGFLIACLAIAPHLFIEVYFGHAGRYVVQMVGNHRRTAHLHDLVLLGSFAACIVLMVMASRMARRAVLQVVAEPDGEGTIRSAAS